MWAGGGYVQILVISFIQVLFSWNLGFDNSLCIKRGRMLEELWDTTTDLLVHVKLTA